MTEYTKNRMGAFVRNIILFVLLFGLSTISAWVIMCFNTDLQFDEREYYLCAGVLLICGFMCGIFFAKCFKSWDLEGFVHRIENWWTADFVLNQVEKLKRERGWTDGGKK